MTLTPSQIESPETGYGYCQCGCGGKTRISPGTIRAYGWVKGEPRRFIHGHQGRKPIATGYIVDEETGCWVWQRACSGGYGTTYVDGRSTLVHRFHYEQARGPIPEGLQIDHLCRNRRCVNPEHLEAVTPAENTRRGVRTKLSPADVAEIRRGDLSALEASERFGVTRTHVYILRKGKLWQDVA